MLHHVMVLKVDKESVIRQLAESSGLLTSLLLSAYVPAMPSLPDDFTGTIRHVLHPYNCTPDALASQ